MNASRLVPGGATKRRLGVLAMAVALIGQACSSTPAATPAPTAAATAAPSSAGSAAPSTGVKRFDGRTLNILVDGIRDEWDGSLIPSFEAATGAKVVLTGVPFEGLDAKYASILASKDKTYDAITAINPTAPAFRDTLFAPMEGLIDPAILADLTAADRVGGKTYSFPILHEVHLFYWNKAYYEKAGLDPEKPPTSFDELFAHCDKLKTAYPDKFCFDWELSDPNTSIFYWFLLLNAAGGTMYSDDLKTVAFNTPQGLAAMETFLKITKYADPGGYAVKTQFETGQRFAAGNTMVNFNWGSGDKDFQDATKSKFVGQIGASIVPGIGGQRSGSADGWEGYGINVYSENQDLAAAWIEHTVGHDAQAKFRDDYGLSPSRVSFLNSPEWTNSLRTLPIVAEQVKYPVSRFGAGFASSVAEVFDQVLGKVKAGTLAPQAALDEAAKQAQAKIDEYYAR